MEQLPDVPVILLESNGTVMSRKSPVIRLSLDNYGGMKQCVTHLIENLHCTSIGYLSGPKEMEEAKLRLNAYRDSLIEHNLPVEERHIVYGDFFNQVDDRVELLFEQDSNLEAIVSANDEMAQAIYRVAKKHGRMIGKDLYVTGFDDIRPASLMNPPLTSIRKNYDKMARIVSHMICQIMNHKNVESSIIQTTLVLRESTGCSVKAKKSIEALGYGSSEDLSSLLLLQRSQLNKSYDENIICALMLRNLQLSNVTESSFFECLGQQMKQIGSRRSYICLLQEPVEMKKYQLIKVPGQLCLYMRQYGNSSISYYSKTAPVITLGGLRKIIQEDGQTIGKMMDFVLFHGRYQYGIMSVELDLSEFSFYYSVSLNIGSALHYLYLSLAQQKAKRALEEKNQILNYTASHDELTGKYNRTGIMSHMFSYLNQYSSQSSFIVFMADLDHLKQINDTFGHGEGDAAIYKASDILADAFPVKGPLGRSGGDEFTGLFLKEHPTDGAVFIQKLKSACEEYNRHSGKPYYIEISIGCCEFRYEDVKILSASIKMADQQLYEAKSHRRSCILR